MKRTHTELLQDLIEEDAWELDLLTAFDGLETFPEFIEMIHNNFVRRITILEGLGVRKHVDE